MGRMFSGATSFNQSLQGWNVESVSEMYEMFSGAASFDQNLNAWDVSAVTDMGGMFRGALSFNGDIENWDVRDVIYMDEMFFKAFAFDQNLGNWSIGAVNNMEMMLDSSGLSLVNYDHTLAGWAGQTNAPENIVLGASGLKYCESQSARQSLIDDQGWTINGDTKECSTFTPSSDNILYVNQNVDQSTASYTGTGDTWANAIPELADALQWAREQDAVDEGWSEEEPLRIFVARGTYLPQYSPEDGLADPENPTDYRDKTFLLVKNVQLYGGFAGTESDPEDRDWESHETILSGDLGTPNDDSDNAYHVVLSSGDAGAALLDGFTISGGNTDGEYSSILVNSFTIWKNNGGGMYNRSSSPVLTNVIINGNTAQLNGGGMYNWDSSSPVLTNVSLNGNTAQLYGGGMYNSSSSPILTNVEITENTSEDNGGGMYNDNSSPVLTNVTLSRNAAQSGGGLHNSFSSPTIYNSIIWENIATDGTSIYNDDSAPQFYHSLLQGSGGSGDDWNTDFGIDGGDNIDADPLFTDPANEDYTLADNSPVINAGNNAYYTDADKGNGDLENDLDLAGNPRLFGSAIDMGAYENQSAVNEPSIITTSGGTTTFTKPISGSPLPIAVAAALVVTDSDNSTLFSANIAITRHFQSGEDDLGFSNEGSTMGTIAGNYDSGVEILTLTYSDALASLFVRQAAIMAVSYHNTPATSNMNNRTVTFTVNDGQDDSSPVTKTIEIEVEVFQITPSTDNILYVNQDVTGGNGSGDSWENAIPELADALQWAGEQHAADTDWLENDSLRIWVAKGTYLPKYTPEDNHTDPENPANPRDKSFLMVKNVQIYGGFAGTESDLEDRDWESHETILSGDLGTPNDDSDNAYHVMISAGDAGIASLDGFTISGGNGDGGSSYTISVNGVTNISRHTGGGMCNGESSPTLTNVTISGNTAVTGGGIYNQSSSPVLTQVTISGNRANYGGGMSNYNSSSPSLTHVTVSGNTATRYGGGKYNWSSSSPGLTHVESSGSTAHNDGGGMYGSSSSADVRQVPSSGDTDVAGGCWIYYSSSSAGWVHVMISGNTDAVGGGIYNQSSSPVLTNVEISGNTAVTGGGIYNQSSSPVLTQVTISGNRANYGGGMSNYNSSSPSLTHVTVSGNTATWYGGGMYNWSSSSPGLTHVEISGNTANNDGGGMYNSSSSPGLTHVEISGNTADFGGGIYNQSSSPVLTNVEISGNTADRKSTRLNSSHVAISYAVFCLKKQ